jgi:UDP-N-acetyl-D-glucosamine dehydrogenase
VPSYREDGHSRAGVELTDEVLAGADAVVIVTDHRAVDYKRLVAKSKVIVDTRNALAKLPPGKARIVTLAKR